MYAGASLFNSGLAFLLIPVLTRFLTPADYGIVGLFVLAAGVTEPFVSLNVHAAIALRYYADDREGFPDYVATALALCSGSGLLVGLLLVLCAPWVATLTFLPPAWVVGFAVLAWSNTAANVLLSLLQVSKRALPYAALQVCRTVLNLGVSLWLVVGLDMGWRGRVGGILAAAIAAAGVSLLVLWRQGGTPRPRPARVHAHHQLAYGVPLIPHVLATTAMAITDRFFLGQMIGVAEVGIYTLGYQFGSIIGLLQDAFNKAYVPWLYERLKRGDPAELRGIVKLTYLYAVVIVFCALLLAGVSPWILSWVAGEEFRGAAPYVFWIGLGFAFNGMYKMVANYVFFAERTRSIAAVTVLSAGLNLPITYALIRANGPLGAAQATTGVFALSFVLTWIVAARAYPMPWRLWSAAKEVD